MTNKILSIIVPSYNMEAYLPKCLGSLVIDDKDLLQKLDVIVVNDGSKDRTSEIAHEFETKYPGVFRVIDKPNGHYGSCINAALPVALGEYVKVLDADDSVRTGAFGKLLVGIEEELQKGDLAADLIISDYVSVDPDGVVVNAPKCDVNAGSTTLMAVRSKWFGFSLHTICYRTENLRKMQYRQTEGIPYTDTEWIIEPMITVRSLRYFPVAVTNYLVGREGQTMDPKFFATSFNSMLHIAKGLIFRYGRNYAKCEESAKSYYKQKVINTVEMSYRWGLLGYNGIQFECDIADFDEYLSYYPEFYKLSGNFTYGLNHFPFRFVKVWRRHGKNWYWKLRMILCNLLIRIAKWLLRKARSDYGEITQKDA